MEFDLDKALEDVPVHVEEPPTSVAPPRQEKRRSGASASVAELPSEESKKLQHFTKLRPRRNKNKTTQSSKSPVRTPTILLRIVR